MLLFRTIAIQKKWLIWTILAITLVGAIAGGAGLLWKRQRPRPRPNVLIITMDTTRADHLGCYGYQPIRTPNIDAVAAEGVLFEEAYSVQPVTLPSHCSIMTGKYPFHHGVRDNNLYKLADENLTLADILFEQGYLTTAFLASYILDKKFGLAQGFYFYNDRFIQPKQKGRLPVDRRASEVSFLAREWLGVVAEDLKTHPFFLWLHYYDPHADYDPPQPYRSAYPNLYDGEIAYMDDWIGYLFQELKQRGLWDNTLVVMTADHGESLGEYSEQTHGIFIYRPTTHVPLLIRYPRALPQGVRIQTRVSSVDIVPTVLDALKIKTPAAFDGESLLPLIKGKKSQKLRDRAIYSEAFIPTSFNWSELQGIRAGEWFYIAAPQPELYQLDTQGASGANLNASQPQMAEELRTRLLTMLKDTDTAKTEQVVVDNDMIQRLRELGYFAGGGESTPDDESGSVRPDPKEKIQLFNVYQRANNLIARGNYQAGAALFERIIAQDPENIRFRLEAGDAYREAGDFPNAEKHLQYALKLRPDDTQAHYLLGGCYDAWGQPNKALQEYQATLALSPNHFLSHFRSGLIHIAANRWDEAEQAFLQTRRLKPNDPSVLNNLGYIAIKGQNKTPEGLRLIHQALEAAPADPEILGSLGSAYATTGEYAQAAKYLEDSLALVPDDLRFIAELKTVYQHTGDAEKLSQLEARERLLGE